MKATIKINWEIEIGIETDKDVRDTYVLELMLNSTDLKDTFGDIIQTAKFSVELNEALSEGYKVSRIVPRLIQRSIILNN